VFTAAPRLAKELELASTSRMWQSGQVADTMSTSSEISSAQLAFLRGSEVVPVWPTLRKHPLAVVHAGRPNWLR